MNTITENLIDSTPQDNALATLCIPGTLLFAEEVEHILDARRRAAQHIARARLATNANETEREDAQIAMGMIVEAATLADAQSIAAAFLEGAS
jgi:hypothetical protein